MSVSTAEGLDHGLEDGIEWKTIPSPLGNCINGYAHIPAGHPWLALADYLDIPADAPGGLTYGPEPERELFGRTFPAHDAAGWIGFDTAHAFDWWSPAELREIGGAPLFRTGDECPDGCTAWTRSAVANQARALARQIAAAVVTA